MPVPAPADVERVFREEYGRAVAVLEGNRPPANTQAPAD